MRERWLLQGMAAEEGEARRVQLEQDEEEGKRLEDRIHRWVVEMLARSEAPRGALFSASFWRSWSGHMGSSEGRLLIGCSLLAPFDSFALDLAAPFHFCDIC